LSQHLRLTLTASGDSVNTSLMESRWPARLAGFGAALVSHAVIIAALIIGARPGAPVLWQPAAHAVDLSPRQEIIADVSMPLSTNSSLNRSRSVRNIGTSVYAMRPPSLVAPSVDEALLAEPAVPVGTEPLIPATGNSPIRCEVHIHQDARGRVQAIDFGLCTGDQSWQRNLLERLQQAARLVRPNEGTGIAPVRTLVVDTDSISPEILAAQLMEPAASPAETHDLLNRAAR
jgi:hypothetical protein